MAPQVDTTSKKRLLGLGLFFIVLLIAIIARSFHLQILSSEALTIKAQKQHTAPLVVLSDRGNIYDRTGEKLAINVTSKSAFADPSKIKLPAETAAKLAPILKMDEASLLSRLQRNSQFAWLARHLDHSVQAEVEKLNLDGIYFIDEPKRLYPNGELAGQLLGFVGRDNNGLAGLEFRYDTQLSGRYEGLGWIRDAKGKKIYPRRERLPDSPDTPLHITLTIDRRIQHIAETQLNRTVKEQRAKGGMVIVMDPRTGQILALAGNPTFNPNNLDTNSRESSSIKSIIKNFDPGSTFKPFLLAAALDSGQANKQERFYCENGRYVVADRVIREAQGKKYGALTLNEILKYSSNIGTVKVSEKLGRDKFYDYISQFGFGARTGIDLPGESSGILRPAKRWTRVDQATISFGQGISVTAIQLISAFSALANDGVLLRPQVVKEIFDEERREVQTFRPVEVRRVVSPEVARAVTAMLAEAVNAPDGTGKNARIMNITVAGKTGTAQKFDQKLRRYSSDRVQTSFIGFLPAEKPKLTLLVILDEPQKDRWGGVASAPVFKNIATQILTTLKHDILEGSPFLLKDNNINPENNLRLVTAGENLISATLSTPPIDESRMPNFLGMTIREAVRIARARGIEISTIGSGWAVNQEPEAGVPLGERPTCRVTFNPGQ